MRKIFFSFFFFLLLLSSVFGQSYNIGEQTINIIDPNRSNRSIETKVYYPAAVPGQGQPVAGAVGEQFPLVVIGHGFSMTFDAYQNFWEELVPQGYIVALPTTESSVIPFPSHADFGADLSKVVDYFLAENNNNASAYYNKVSGKVAVMGHSMGGGASFLAVEGNPNVTTLVGFAPAETNPSAIAAASNIDIPALIFIGSLDNVAPAADHATSMYNALSPGCKTYITITGGSHCGFANQNTTCELGETTVCIGCNFISRQDQHNTTFEFLNPWLRFHLKGACEQWSVFQDLLNTSPDITYQQSCNITEPVAEFSVIGDTVFCQGNTATLTALGDYDFWWSNGDTNRVITLTSTGDYNLVVTDPFGCQDTSGSISFTVGGGVVPEIQFSDDNVLCKNESVKLSVAGNFNAYQWSTGSTDPFIMVDQAGSYYVILTDDFGCDVFSDTVAITTASSDTPRVVLRHDTLFALANDAQQFLWYLDGNALNTFTDSFLNPYFEGTYAVRVWNSNGCSAISEDFVYQFSGVGQRQLESDFLFYPNPTDGLLYLEGQFQQVRLFDVVGIELRKFENRVSRIDLSDLEPGIYLLRVDGNSSKGVKKLLKR